jgi:proteasome lid subunit RPN8/RPN11
MSVFIPEKLRDLVNNWLQDSDRKKEHGGVFFGTDTEFTSFLPVPNFSETPYNSFNKGNSKYYVAEFGKMIGLKPIAGMHTHPNGSIPSETDTKYIKGSDCPLEVVISDHGSEFKWFCFDRDLKHVNLYFRDSDLEKSFLLITQSFGMTDLGRVMVTPKHELLCESKLGRSFLTLDADTMIVNQWFEKNATLWRKSKTQIQKDTGLSATRVNTALKKLGKEDDLK